MGFSWQEYWSGLPFPSPCGKVPPVNAEDAGDAGSIPDSGRSSGRGQLFGCVLRVDRASHHSVYCSIIYKSNKYTIASLVAQMVKRLPVMRETRVRFLGREDLLEKEMPVHSSTLAWKIPWMEEPGYSPWGRT